MTSKIFAALDCGTNSTRLLIEDGDGNVLAREMRITRLGKGVDSTGALSDEAMERTLSVLREFRETMDAAGVNSGRLAATSAARDALNGQEFLDEATKTSGVRAEILTGEEEGSLSFAGAMVGLDPGSGDDVVLDIGGGSSEIVLVRDSQLFAHSMQVGCVRVSERTLLSDPPSRGECAVARAMADEALDSAVASVPLLASLAPESRLIALAGTVATLAMVEQELVDYDRDRVHHFWLSLDVISKWREVLANETSAERAKRPGMVPGREDVIVGGLIVLEATLERLGFSGCLTSESDILDGMVASLRTR